MAADGIEITKQNDVPFVVRFPYVRHDVFHHQLGCAVRVGRGKTAIFGQRESFRRAVYGCRRREDNFLHVVFIHYLQQIDRAADVVFIIFQGKLAAFANRLESREMNDGVKLVRGKDFFQSRGIANVVFIERYGFAGDLLHSTQTFIARIAEIIHHDHVIVLVQKLQNGMRADIAAAARYENCLHNITSIF